jgi:hypothetical protein
MFAAWRSRLGFVALAALCLLLPACEAGGHFNLLGYSTRPNYNPDIRTVRLPIFKNESYWKELEFDLTEALIREIESKTPYKVVPASQNADSELTGTIVSGNKSVVILNQLGEVRDAETTLTVQVVWRDLPLGCIGDVLAGPPVDPSQPGFVPPPPLDAPRVLVQSMASFRPELGESLASSKQRMVQRMARQIVFMMESPY